MKKCTKCETLHAHETCPKCGNKEYTKMHLKQAVEDKKEVISPMAINGEITPSEI